MSNRRLVVRRIVALRLALAARLAELGRVEEQRDDLDADLRDFEVAFAVLRNQLIANERDLDRARARVDRYAAGLRAIVALGCPAPGHGATANAGRGCPACLAAEVLADEERRRADEIHGRDRHA